MIHTLKGSNTMTYTISTEPVTREHIGRKILTREDNTDPLDGPFTLVNVTEEDYINESGVRFWIDYDGNTIYVDNALLIADDSEQ